MIRIAFLFSARGFGGILKNVSLIINNLNREKFLPKVILLGTANEKHLFERLLKRDDIEVVLIEEKGRFDLSATRKIKDLLIADNTGILSCHGYKADFYGAVLKKFYRLNIKLVVIVHGWVAPGLKMKLYSVLDKISIRFFDRVILVSKAQENELGAKIIDSGKVSVINNAIDAKLYDSLPDPLFAKKGFNIPTGEPVVGFSGRLCPEKDLLTVFKALAILNERGIKIFFAVAGEGPLRTVFAQKVQSMGLSESVLFLGFIEEITKFLTCLDFFVLASFKEGLPNALLEAQAAGIPCIASNVGGNNEIISDGENGLLFTRGNAKELAEKINQLLNDRELAKKLSASGKERIKRKFSLTARINKLEGIYLSLDSYHA